MLRMASEINLPKLPLLKEDELRELIELAQNGQSEAKDRLVQHNLRLVMSIVMRFAGRGEEEDLFQIGCMGLIKAIDRFNVELGVQFSTYAVPLIMGEIRQFLREDGPIKVSRNLRDIARNIGITRERFLQETGREPTISELEEATQLSRQEIAAALEASQPIRYLQESIGGEESEEQTLGDRVAESGDPQELSWFEGMALHEVVGQLEPRLRRVLEMRFFEEKTQAQVAEVFHLSQVQISRLEKEALRLLRETLKE